MIRNHLKKDWTEFNGKSELWQGVVNLMDDELRERVHNEPSPCSEEEFFTRYEELDDGRLGDVGQW